MHDRVAKSRCEWMADWPLAAATHHYGQGQSRSNMQQGIEPRPAGLAWRHGLCMAFAYLAFLQQPVDAH